MSAPFSSRGLLLAVWLASLVLLPGLAAARPESERDGEAPARFEPLPARLTAGDEMELRWSELPGETEELELLLSLDDGRTFHVRVSEELQGGTRHYRWRVPNLPAERARLRLRIGGRERESEGATSPAFESLGALGAALELDQVHEGNWWSGFASAWAHVPGAGTSAPRATLAPARARHSRRHRVRPWRSSRPSPASRGRPPTARASRALVRLARREEIPAAAELRVLSGPSSHPIRKGTFHALHLCGGTHCRAPGPPSVGRVRGTAADADTAGARLMKHPQEKYSRSSRTRRSA
jgi:hypothetical protein